MRRYDVIVVGAGTGKMLLNDELQHFRTAMLLDGPLTYAEPKKLRYRLPHVAAKLTCTARTSTLRIAADWPWTEHLVQAFQRLGQLPETVT